MNRSHILSVALVVVLAASCARAALPATQTIAPTPIRPTATIVPSPTPLLADSAFLAKPDESVRFLSFNVNWDSIFPLNDPESHDLRFFDRSESFVRIMAALQPDVVCLQEINPARDAADVAAYLDAIIDLEGDQGWNAVLVRDTVIASRFELDAARTAMLGSSNIPNLEQAAALVDLPSGEFGPADLFVVCAHFKSGSNIADERMRQRQADALVAHLRETAAGVLTAGTPLIISGDFNLYELDDPAFLPTLVAGNLDNEAIYGADFAPDWDGTSLTDLLPSHNGLGRDFYTWRDDGEPFEPGALDRIIYSDSVLAAANAFVLDTTQISTDGLETAGLHAGDVLLDAARLNFDHLPLVVDFMLSRSE